MKILFESKAGKKVEKTFNTLTEAKTFVLKNKKVIKEAQIMEGPLGSGGWTPKKAYHNFKKGYERFNNLQKMDKTKDSFGQNIFNYLTAIVGNVGKDMEMTNTFGIGRDEKGYYIFADDYAYREFKDDEYENKERVVSPYSEKYKNFIAYIPFAIIFIVELVKRIKNREIRFLDVFSCTMAGYLILFYIGMLIGKVSPYYMIKLYFVIWIVIFAVTIDILNRNINQKLFRADIIVFAILFAVLVIMLVVPNVGVLDFSQGVWQYISMDIFKIYLIYIYMITLAHRRNCDKIRQVSV